VIKVSSQGGMIEIKQKLDLMQAMGKGHEAWKTFYILLIV
jgi:hypothetical protein